MNNGPIKIAAVGCVDVARLAAWARLPGVQIEAVCDAAGALAARTSALFPGCSAFTTVDDLVAAGPYDLVDVSVSASQQFEASALCIKSKCNVICSVPFTGTSALAQLVGGAASRCDRLFVPSLPLRFHPLIQALKQLVDDDELGTVALVEVFLSAGKPATPPAHGASLISNLQGVDLARYIAGELTLVKFAKCITDPTWEVDDTASLLMESSKGIVTVTSRWAREACGNRVSVSGSAGAAIIDLDAAVMRYSTASWPEWRTSHASDARPLWEMSTQIAEALKSDRALPVTFNDGYEALRLCGY